MLMLSISMKEMSSRQAVVVAMEVSVSALCLNMALTPEWMQ